MRPRVSWFRSLLRSLGWERQAAAKQSKIDTTPVVLPPSTDLVAVINETRARHGIGLVFEDARLNHAAKLQADWQAECDRLSHDGPPGMRSPADRLAWVGVKAEWSESGEICAMGQRGYWPDGRLAIDYDFRKSCLDWLTSPGHKAILLGQFTHAGAFMSTAKSGRIYSTAVFLRRAS